MKWGMENESTAIAAYEAVNNRTVKPTGLTLDIYRPYLGASGDGLVDQSIVLEVKCPGEGKKSISELLQNGYNHIHYDVEKKSYSLRSSSIYFAQVQGEMAIKKCNVCHFLLWTPFDFVVIPVEFDQPFWQNVLLPKLDFFFQQDYIANTF